MSLEQFVMERRVLRDERTGRELWQVTDGDFECVTPYMDRCTWTPDDRYLVFMCNRSGTWQPYRLELATGQATQLFQIEDSKNHHYYALAFEPNANEAYFPNGSTFVAVDVYTLKGRVAADFGGLFGPSGGGRQPVLSGDGKLIYASVKASGKAVKGQEDASQPAKALIARTDNSGPVQVIELADQAWIWPCHEQFCPTDDNVISICGLPDYQDDVDAPPNKRVREWRLDRDTGRLSPLVAMPPGQRATHCVWGLSGERFYFHRKTCPWHVWVPTALCSVDKDGRDLRVYYETSEHKLGHSCPSPDEKWLVTDSQDPDENILAVVNLHSGQFEILCWPNMSIDEKQSKRPDKRLPHLPAHSHRHIHPHWSISGNYVNYVSDVSGRSHLYVVPVADIVGR